MSTANVRKPLLGVEITVRCCGAFYSSEGLHGLIFPAHLGLLGGVALGRGAVS
jgi:hypothetical protein